MLKAADAHHQCLEWVKGSKSLSERMLSEFPQIADIVRSADNPRSHLGVEGINAT